MLAQIAREHPENLQAAIEAVSNWKSYTETVTFQGDSLDPVQNYFFALIAMTCLYGSFMACIIPWESRQILLISEPDWRQDV